MDKEATSKTTEVIIEDLVYGGEGIGHLGDGKTIFIPYTLPGERVLVSVTEEKKNYSRGKLVQLLEPAPNRIQPLCRHYTRCGGCHYQHMAYANQLEFKQKILTDQLRRVGKIENPPAKPIIPSPMEWNYRNTVQFHIADNGKLGFRGAGSAEVIVITECHLPHDGINQLWPTLEIDPEYKIERVIIRAGEDEELLLGLECEHDDPPDFSLDFSLSVEFLGKNNDLLLSGEPYSRMRIRDFDFLVSARSFFQVNNAQAEAMVDFVLREGSFKEAVVFDVYCGVGLFSRFIAPLARQLVGVEYSESACNDYAANLDDFEHVSLYMGKAEGVLDGIEVNPDVILVDPPRAGLERPVLDWIAASTAAQLLYVSCDPTTLARDVRLLVERGWILTDVQPFDLFPQTYHIESISILTRQNLA